MHEDLAIPHHVVVLALPQVVALDLTIATHAFGADGSDRYRLTLCAPVAGPVATTSGFEIHVAHGLEALTTADTVIVPGFDREPVPVEVLEALRQSHRRGARIASICTGAFALARAGLLDGRRATTHWMHAAQLAAEHPAVTVEPAAIYIDEQTILTSAGVTAGIDLCLYLIGRDFGPEAAVERARRMVAPLHRSGDQLQYVPPTLDPVCGPDHGVAAAMAWAQDHLDHRITLELLARRSLQAPRTFSRSFVRATGISPMDWVTRQRLRAACRLLEDPRLTVDAVAARCGLGTAANLRLHFRRAYATTPTAYRAAFSGPADPDALVRPV